MAQMLRSSSLTSKWNTEGVKAYLGSENGSLTALVKSNIATESLQWTCQQVRTQEIFLENPLGFTRTWNPVLIVFVRLL